MPGRSADERAIRLLTDGSGLVDESGTRWDRVRGAGYFLTPDEVAALGTPARCFVTGSFGTPVEAIEDEDHDDRVARTGTPRQLAFRSRADGALALLLDVSDC